MKHFDKIKGHLRDSNEELPENLSWELMEDSIFGDDSDDKKGFWFRNWKNFLIASLSIGLIVITGMLVNTMYNDSDSQESTTLSDDGQSALEAENKLNQKRTNTINQGETQEVNTDTKVAYEIENQANIKNNTLSSDNIEIKEKNQILNNREVLEATGQNLNSKQGEKSWDNAPVSKEEITTNSQSIVSDINAVRSSSKVNISDKNRIGDETRIQKLGSIENTLTPKNTEVKKIFGIEDVGTNEQIPNPKADLPTSNNADVRRVILIDLLKSDINVLAIDQTEIKMNQEVVGVKPIQPMVLIDPWSISIGGGVNYWNPGANQDAYESISSQIGYQYGAELAYSINNKWSVLSGLSMSAWNTRLDYSNVRLEERLLEDTLIGSITNPVSGIKKDVIGDTYVVDTITRIVAHNNSYKALQMPLMVNYTVKKGRYSYGLGIGMSASVLRSYDGRLQQGKDFPEFSSIETLYDNELALGAMMRFNIERKLNDKFGIGINVNINRQLTDWSDKEEFRLNATQVSSNLYMKYRF